MEPSQGLNKLIPIHKRFKAFMIELEKITKKDRLDLCSEPEMLDFVKSGFKYYNDLTNLDDYYNRENQGYFPDGSWARDMPKDILFTTNYKEMLADWIPRQHSIVGCQMYLQVPEILNLLANVKGGVCIVVNYSKWMADAESKSFRDKIFSLYSRMNWGDAYPLDLEDDFINDKFDREDISDQLNCRTSLP